MMKRLGKRSTRDIIIADRGYASIELIETVRDAGADLLFRVPDDFIKETMNLPKQDCDIEVSFTIFTRQTNESKKMIAEGKAKWLPRPSWFE